MWSYALTAPRHFERVEVPAPDESGLEEDQVLLRTLAGAVCGSDLAAYTGRGVTMPQFRGAYAPNFPGFPMHEVLGEVVASKSPLFAKGSRVVGWASEDNAVSEYVVTYGDRLAQVDDDLAPTTAILIQ